MTAIDDAKAKMCAALAALWNTRGSDVAMVAFNQANEAIIDAKLAACVANAQVVIPVPPGFTVDAPVGRPGHGPSGSVGCCACGHVHQRADFCDWGNAFECCPCTWPHAAPAATERAEEPRWRVGRKLGRTLYRDGECVGMVDDETTAGVIVHALNEYGRAVDGLDAALRRAEAAEKLLGQWKAGNANTVTLMQAANDRMRLELATLENDKIDLRRRAETAEDQLRDAREVATRAEDKAAEYNAAMLEPARVAMEAMRERDSAYTECNEMRLRLQRAVDGAKGKDATIADLTRQRDGALGAQDAANATAKSLRIQLSNAEAVIAQLREKVAVAEPLRPSTHCGRTMNACRANDQPSWCDCACNLCLQIGSRP
jgi:hypothetical protein